MTDDHVSEAQRAGERAPLDQLDVADLKRRNPLEAVAASCGLKLVRRGQFLAALCPFHAERTPSFIIDPGSGRWRCFGRCSLDGRWRDVIDFVGMMIYGPAWNSRNPDMFRAALARLDAGALPAPAAAQPQVAPAPPTVSLTPEVVYLLGKASWMYAAYLRAQGAGPGTPWAYLRSRGFTDETIERHRLGYCPGRGRNILLETIRQTGFPVERARALRLLDEAHGDREFLRGRIVFPCLDTGGRVVHLAGRKWASCLHPRAPKYLALYGLPKPLYGLAQLQPGQGPVLVTESLPDWLTLAQWGLDAVCTLGTGLAPAHAAVLRRLGRPLVYVPQNDSSGAGHAAVAAWRERVGQGVVLELPEDVKDVNELAVAGRRAEFLARLARAAPGDEFQR